MLTRRQFSKLLAGSPLLASSKFGPASAASLSPAQDMAQALTQSRDLLIKGGTVIDPSQNLHAPLDVAVKDGKILQVAPDIPADGSRNVLSAKGKIVTPGLIDVHVHVFEGVGPTGLNADQYCLGRGVTTAVDAGSTGYFSIAGFRQYVIKPSATRIFAMVDIGARGTLMGLVGNYSNLDWVNPQRTAQAAEANKPDVVAIKTRLSKEIAGANDLEVLKRALLAAELCHLPLMVHIGDTYSPLPQIMPQLIAPTVQLPIAQRLAFEHHCHRLWCPPHLLLDQLNQAVPLQLAQVVVHLLPGLADPGGQAAGRARLGQLGQ